MPFQQNQQKQSIWQKDIRELIPNILPPRIPIKDLSVFCRQLSYLLEAGVYIKNALPILIKQTSGRMLSLALSDVHIRVLQGQSLSQALQRAKVFPPFMYHFLAIGEETGQMSKVCSQLADYYEEQHRTGEELIATLMYPIIVTLSMLAVAIMAVTIVLPSYAQIFETTGVPLPALTVILLAVSRFLTRNAIIILIVLLVITALAIIGLRKERGKSLIANVKLRIPLLRQHANFRLTQTLSLLLSSGMTITEALPLCYEVMGNVQIRHDVQRISIEINKGREFWKSLDKVPYVDKLFIGMSQVGEETGNLSQSITKAHEYLESAYKHSIRRINKLIEPLIMLVMGIFLAIIMLAVILPIFELATAI